MEKVQEMLEMNAGHVVIFLNTIYSTFMGCLKISLAQSLCFFVCLFVWVGGFFLFCFVFLEMHPRHMEVPRLGVKLEL